MRITWFVALLMLASVMSACAEQTSNDYSPVREGALTMREGGVKLDRTDNLNGLDSYQREVLDFVVSIPTTGDLGWVMRDAVITDIKRGVATVKCEFESPTGVSGPLTARIALEPPSEVGGRNDYDARTWAVIITTNLEEELDDAATKTQAKRVTVIDLGGT